MYDPADDYLDRELLAQLEPAARERIEIAVLEIFSAREFHKVRLIEVATQAQVSLQTLYKYYGSKETLLYACLDTWLGVLGQRMVDHLNGIETFRDRLGKVFWLALDFFENNPKVAQLIMSSVYLNTWRQREELFDRPELMGVILRTVREGREQGILTDEVDERAIMDFVFGVMSRAIAMWIHRGQEQSLTAQTDALFAMTWRGIAKANAD